MMSARDKGFYVEQQACLYLKQQGMKFVTRNFQRRGGEIDLIMLDGSTLVFVEVRFRRSGRFGSAIESVNAPKQQRIIQTAGLFLQQSDIAYHSCRFDVIAVSPADSGLDIQWIQDAFRPS